MDSLRIFAKTILMHCKFVANMQTSSYYKIETIIDYLNAGFSQHQIFKILEPYHLCAHL